MFNSDLTNWISSKHRKPIIIRGARQVGKTWMVRRLAELSGKQLIELNFEKKAAWRELFSSNEPANILLHLESELNINIQPENALLFLDEIQAAPDLLSKLRWFYEDMPELPVVAAGSLLEFVLGDHSFSMPVGRISYLYVEPLSFEEFLQASNKNKLWEFLQQWQWGQNIPISLHEQLLGYIKEYVLIGGMPEAVFNWQEQRSLETVAEIHEALLTTYREDFVKYAEKISPQYLEELLSTIPQLLGEKFMYSKVNRQVSSEILKKGLQLLCMARVCHKISATYANGVPLGAEIKDNFFKMILLDIGLATAFLDVRLHHLKNLNEQILVNQGGLSEQLAGQLLRTIEPSYKDPRLYYWLREEKGTNAEIDYLLQHEGHIIPIEVKSGSTGSLKSLHYFMHLKSLTQAIRINADLPSQVNVSTKIHSGDLVAYQLHSIPFYLIGQLHRLLSSICSTPPS